MLFRKIKSAKFFNDQGLNNITFEPKEYGIYDGFDIIKVSEEDMRVDIIAIESDITIEYKNEWVRHPLKNDDGVDYPDNLDELGEELLEEIEKANNNMGLGRIEVETSNLLFFSDKNNDLNLKETVNDFKRFKIKSLGGNTYNLSIGTFPNSLKTFIQVSLMASGVEKDRDIEMGIRLIPTKVQLDSIIKYLTENKKDDLKLKKKNIKKEKN